MSTKRTNDEILRAVAESAAIEGAASIFDENDAAAAAKLAVKSISSSMTRGSALYNKATGLLAKIVEVNLSSAKYRDVYARHHRGYIAGGDIELGFMAPAEAGTGNDGQIVELPLSTPYDSQMEYTTVTTAKTPHMYNYYEKNVSNRVARVPISERDVKTAFTDDYGISNYIEKVRESVNAKLTADANTDIDSAIASVLTASCVMAGSGSALTDDYYGGATVELTAMQKRTTYWKDAAKQLTAPEIEALLVSIKTVALKMTGRPVSTYVATGLDNNADDMGRLVAYINPDVYANVCRLTAFAYNMNELREMGLEVKPMSASWLDSAATISTVGYPVVALVCSEDWLRDWLITDYTTTVPTDAGVILTHKVQSIIARCGYEPAAFICCDPAATVPTKVYFANWNNAPSTLLAVYTRSGNPEQVKPGGTAAGTSNAVVDLSLYAAAADSGTVTGTQTGSTIPTFTITAGGSKSYNEYLTGKDLTITYVAGASKGGEEDADPDEK